MNPPRFMLASLSRLAKSRTGKGAARVLYMEILMASSNFD